MSRMQWASIIESGSAVGHPAGTTGKETQQDTRLGCMSGTLGETRRQNQRAKEKAPQRATCVCSCRRSSRVSTSNSSHSLETSMVRTYSACIFATKPPPLPRGSEQSSSNTHEGKSTGAPATPSKLVRQICPTALQSQSTPARSPFVPTPPATLPSGKPHCELSNAARPLFSESLSRKDPSATTSFTEPLLRRTHFEATLFAEQSSAVSHFGTSATPPSAAPRSAAPATSHPTTSATPRPAVSRLAAPAASRSAARRSAAMLAGRIRGWSPWTNVTVSHPSMASMPRRTVSFLQGSSCKITCAPSVSHNAATSAWRVTTTRRLNKPSVARTTWPTSGASQSSAMSLLPPKRAPTPDAITMHPCFNVRLSAACGIAVFAFANSMVGRAEFGN